jgi:hypothetical protein
MIKIDHHGTIRPRLRRLGAPAILYVIGRASLARSASDWQLGIAEVCT